MLKHLRRAKRSRDKKKRDEKVLKKVDGFVLTKHAVNRANERSVALHDIKSVLKYGTVEQTGAKTFRVTEGENVVVVAEKQITEQSELDESHLTVITTWSSGWKQKKQKKQKKKS